VVAAIGTWPIPLALVAPAVLLQPSCENLREERAACHRWCMSPRLSSTTKGIGVALSGGGHRASLFGLGVLLYLADAGKLPEITSLSSVSGGSLTNGYIAQSLDLTKAADGAPFQREMEPFAKQLAQRGTLFASPITWGYVGILALSGLAAAIVPWILPLPGIVQFLICLASLLLWAGVVASRRSWIAAQAFRRTLFSPTGSPTLLRDIHGQLDHLFCATDLQAAEQIYFSKTFVYGYRFGVGNPATLPLHDAVQASACLPGAFPPRWFRAERFRFRYPDDEVHPEDPCPKRVDRPQRPPSFLVLTDGGAYDNMGDQWAIGRRGRTDCFPDPNDLHPEPRDLIVVNASAGLGWVPFRRSRIPGIGELLSLLKVKDVLYDQTTATRRRMLNDRARQVDRTGQGMRIALVNIPRSPFDLPTEFARYGDSSGHRANMVLAALGNTEREWEADATANATGVKTSLSKMGTEISARLLHHGYVLAMANLHVVMDYPLLPVPDRKRFIDLVS
jgi:predicted acylesterase/phospholipase RssA